MNTAQKKEEILNEKPHFACNEIVQIPALVCRSSLCILLYPSMKRVYVQRRTYSVLDLPCLFSTFSQLLA